MTNNGEKTFFCSFLHRVMSSFTFTYQQVLHKLYYLCPEIIFFMKKLTIEEMNRISVTDFHKAKKLPLTIILDDIRSFYNIGSIFRTSDAFRVEKIIICGITACPPSVEIHKTALGAEDSVDWQYYENIFTAIDELRRNNYMIVAVEQVEGSTKLNNWNLKKNTKYALILGNEVKGVKQDVVNICDECLEIPQYGTKHSLNVSCTASIVIWEYFRKVIENGISL
ncbi:MAG: RNA methyltransferase [Lachnospiraceae bacterium]|nr:RNA methyltransferase [Lachnospiraceae bacterium]